MSLTDLASMQAPATTGGTTLIPDYFTKFHVKFLSPTPLTQAYRINQLQIQLRKIFPIDSPALAGNIKVTLTNLTRNINSQPILFNISNIPNTPNTPNGNVATTDPYTVLINITDSDMFYFEGEEYSVEIDYSNLPPTGEKYVYLVTTAPSGMSVVLNNILSVSEAGSFISSTGVWHTSNQRLPVLTLLTDGTYFSNSVPPAKPPVGVVEPDAGQSIVVEAIAGGNITHINKVYVETNDPAGNRFILQYMHRGKLQQVPLTLNGAGVFDSGFDSIFNSLPSVDPQSPVTISVSNAGSRGSVYFAHINFRTTPLQSSSLAFSSKSEVFLRGC